MKKLLTLLAGSTLAFYMQGCSDDSSSAGEVYAELGPIYAYGTDYSAGEVRWSDDGELSDKSLQFYKDAKVVAIDSNLFVIEGAGKDNISLVDVTKNEVKWQTSLDDGANPSDVVKASKDEVWVALKDATKFVKVSVKDGKITKSVSTEDFVQKEGQPPRLIDLAVRNDTLFALFGRYISEGWVTTYPAPGLLALYKLDEGKLLDTIKLAKKNPMAMAFAKGKLYVASHGEYNSSYGTDADDARGIEVVDLANRSSSMVADGKKLGGGVFSLAVDSDNGIAYAAINKGYNEDNSGNFPVVEVNLSEKTVKEISGVVDAEGSLAFDDVDGVLYIGDRAADAGILVYANGVLSKSIAPKGALPPYSIAVLR